MKIFTLPNGIQLIGLLLLAMTISAQESPAPQTQLNKNRIGQPGESHAVRQQKNKSAPVEWGEQQNREKFNSSESRLRQPIPGQNMRQKSGAPYVFPVRTENQKKKADAKQNFKILNENLQPADKLTRSDSHGSKDDCPILYMEDFYSVCYDEVEDPCIALGEEVWVWAEFYSGVYWYSYGDGYIEEPWNLYTCYYPGPNDILNGGFEIEIYLEPIYPCPWGPVNSAGVTIPPFPYASAGEDATIYEDEAWVADSAIVENAEALAWTSSGDGTFDNPSLLQTTYTPGLDDIINGIVMLYISAINDCGNTTDSIALTIVGFEKQTIQLIQGWSGISSYLDIRNEEVEQIMAAIEDKLIILKDFEGNAYQPQNKDLLNWDFTKGYYLKMASSDSLEITGLYPLSKQLDLQQGWNLIPVLNDEPVDIEDHFYGNLDKVEIITEVAGLKVFWPDKEITTLQQLNPGKAYLVKTKAPLSLSKLPEVTTAPVTEITAFSAISGGEVTDEGSSSVTDRGVVWSVSPNPTLAQHNGITSNGTGAGAWVSEVTELLPVMTYFLRAYATNSVGTSYGEVLSFTTLWECGYPLFDLRDGQSYATLQIGDQCWMAENLNIGTRINGSSNQTNNGTIEKYCYNDSEANCNVYGGLYQWNEMMGYTTTAGAQGICPEGWHVPTDAEWTELTTYVSSQPEYLCNSNTSYIAKSLAATTNWYTYSGTCVVGNNLSANNATGFTALPGGGRFTGGSFYFERDLGQWWSSSRVDASNAWDRNLGISYAYVGRYYKSKSFGYSVRCLKDN
jgi:uncharacterized protein (TIGR02145 family)